jgi:aldehyde:ferredoxin oxidoreductase
VPGGYTNKIIRINLSSQEIKMQTYPEEILRKYIGGSGLGAKILLEETSRETEPLGPENILIFMTGPMVGTRALNFGRHQVISKSPLTGIYGEANTGGTWGSKLKKAGYDGIIITGKSPEPVFITINKEKIEIKKASKIWGKDTYETDTILKNELGEKIAVCCIGPAGEKLVKYSAIMNDGKHARAAARCGLGAVMGSKKLKAITVYGEEKIKIEKEENLKESIRYWSPIIRENTKELNKYGTAEMMKRIIEQGDHPIKNWRKGTTKAADKLTGPAVKEKLQPKKYYCAQCVIGCGREINKKDGKYGSLTGGGPEYETLAMLGTNCLIDNIEGIAKANELCNRYGIDTISTGAVIAFAMEAYERGIINKKQTGGLELTWNNTETMIKMIKKIAYREDIGDLLAEGVQKASEELGAVSEEFAVHVKGMELPAHDPRAKYSNALAYATSPRGACHMNAFSYEFEAGEKMPELGYPETMDRFTEEKKAEFVAKFQDLMAIFDSLIGCKFLVFGLKDKTVETIIKWLNYVTGWDMDSEELLKTGSRIVNIKRIYNIECRKLRKDDTLPPRILNNTRNEGTAANKMPHLEKMLNEYYSYRGWDEFGIPTEKTLKELSLL